MQFFAQTRLDFKIRQDGQHRPKSPHGQCYKIFSIENGGFEEKIKVSD